MFNYKQTLESMKKEQAAMQAELEKLTRAISALEAVVDSGLEPKPKSRVKSVRSSKVTTEQRKRAKRAQRPKAKISAQGLKNIVEAQKRRWAKVKAAAKAKPKTKVAEA
ncbi:MAG: hypothetical protein AB1898_30280 [Acidobacteriota bacterium]